MNDEQGASCLFKVSTVNPLKKATSTIEHAIAHNRRTTQAAHGARSSIDPMRSRLNYCLKGDVSPNAIVQRVRAAMKEHRAPKNAPHATEVLISLPANWQGDTRALFTDAIPYLEGVLGADNLLSADVHLDEANPHMHVLFLPLEHCEKKGRLVWRNRLGDAFKARRRSLYADFFSVVGQRHDISKPIKLTGKVQAALALAVIDAMQRSGDGATRGKTWEATKDAIKANPKPFAVQIGLNLAQFINSKNTLGGFDDAKSEHHKNPHSVYGGLATATALTLRIEVETVPVHAESGYQETTRERENEFMASDWNSEQGGFYQRPAKQSIKPFIDSAVSKALKSRDKK